MGVCASKLLNPEPAPIVYANERPGTRSQKNFEQSPFASSIMTQKSLLLSKLPGTPDRNPRASQMTHWTSPSPLGLSQRDPPPLQSRAPKLFMDQSESTSASLLSLRAASDIGPPLRRSPSQISSPGVPQVSGFFGNQTFPPQQKQGLRQTETSNSSNPQPAYPLSARGHTPNRNVSPSISKPKPVDPFLESKVFEAFQKQRPNMPYDFFRNLYLRSIESQSKGAQSAVPANTKVSSMIKMPTVKTPMMLKEQSFSERLNFTLEDLKGKFTFRGFSCNCDIIRGDPKSKLIRMFESCETFAANQRAGRTGTRSTLSVQAAIDHRRALGARADSKRRGSYLLKLQSLQYGHYERQGHPPEHPHLHRRYRRYRLHPGPQLYRGFGAVPLRCGLLLLHRRAAFPGGRR